MDLITILHTIDSIEPGGAETVFVDLATRLPNDKYRSIIVIDGKGWIYDQLSIRGIKPIIVNTKGSFNLRYLMTLMTIIRKENIDLIQSHLLGSNVYSSLAGLLTRTPVVATFHGVADITENERFIRAKTFIINIGARCVIAVSKSLRSDLINRVKIRKEKIDVIYNGIITSDFDREISSDIRDSYGWAKNDVIVGSLGNIHPNKGYDILIKAAGLLKHTEITFRFVIAGQIKAGLYDALLKLRSSLGLEDRVHFLGFFEDPAHFLSNIDIFLLTSTSEGFSIATIQAMAANLPVIVTKCGGPEEIIDNNVNGCLIESENPEAIAKSIFLISLNKELQKSLSKNGRKYVKDKFELSVMLNAYKEVYCKMTR